MMARISSEDAHLNSMLLEPALCFLPETVLERILLSTGREGELRYVCKAFYSVISNSLTSLKVPQDVLRHNDSLGRALATFPNTRHVALDLHVRKTQVDCRIPFQNVNENDDEGVLIAGALNDFSKLRHPLSSLAVLHLSSPLALPSATTMMYLATCGLTELELQDVSILRASSDGASNLLRSPPTPVSRQLPSESLADSIRARGSAMVRFACSLPSLRCLSLCNAAFSSSDVVALSVLTQLEELSVTGAMECSGGLASPRPGSSSRSKFLGASAAAPSYKHLLASLPRLRRLRLPMAIPRSDGSRQCDLLDSDDEETVMGGLEGADLNVRLGSGSGNAEAKRGCISAVKGQGNGGAFLLQVHGTGAQGLVWNLLDESGSSGKLASKDPALRKWSFPPLLEELTIPLCFLNGAVFRAACAVYGAGGGGNDAYSCGTGRGGASHLHLRTLHVVCAPGYSVWEGSFLNDDRDFAALAHLAPTLESLHLSLELGGSGRNVLRKDRLRECLRHLRALHKLQDVCISETRQPVCFAVRKQTGGKMDVLSYLLDERNVPHWPCANLRLPMIPALANHPVSSRNWSLSLFPPQVAPQPQLPLLLASCPASDVSNGGLCLDSLFDYWPQLRSLSVCGQYVVRSSSDGRTRLAKPGSMN